MKKHEKDLTKFLLAGNFTNLRKRSWCMAIVLMMLSSGLKAQQACEPEAQFFASTTSGQLLLQVALPDSDPATAYNWSTIGLGGLTGMGTDFSTGLPYSPTNFSVNLNVVNGYINANCSKTVEISATCIQSNFIFNPNGCTVAFISSTPNVISHLWEFGDGTTSTSASPSHTYGQQNSYNVCHTVTVIGPNGNVIIDKCCKVVSVECSGGGGSGGGGTIDPNECCRLKVCFTHPIQDPTASYFWDFGDCHTSTEMNPCNYYDNISTYTFAQGGGTPYAIVLRCITPNGGTQTCTPFVMQLVSASHPPAIYVGEPGVTTPLDVVSCINGLPLFPGSSMVGPKEIHNIGELEINKNFTFSNNINFCMDPCSGMQVPHHRSLTFDNNITVKNGCCLWRSIDLGYSSKFISTNNNTISGAQYGLRTQNTGVVLQLSDTYFDDNWVGIFARHPLTITKFDRNVFHANAIDKHCSAFSCDTELKDLLQIPHLQRGFAGIVGRNTTINLPLGTGLAADNNVFRFMDNGIWLHDSNMEIRRCDFLHIVDESYGAKSGNAIRFNVFSGVRSLKHWGDNTVINNTSTGVRVETSPASANTFFDSRNNGMEVNKYGYRLNIGGSLAQGSTIWDNNILSSLMGIDVTLTSGEMNPSYLNIAGQNNIAINSTSDIGSGILVKDGTPPGTAANNNHDIKIVENFVTLNNGRSGIEVLNFHAIDAGFNVVQVNDASGSGALPYLPIGIYLNGGLQNNVYCNVITGTSAGGPQHALVVESSRDAIISGNTLKMTRIGVDFRGLCGSTTDFTCNTMENHDAALRYWEGAKTGDQFNKGNQWIGTAFNVAAWHMGSTANSLINCRFKAAIGTSQWPPSIIAPSGIGAIPWFSNTSFVNCNTNCNAMLSAAATNDMDLAIATTGFDMPTNSSVYNWDARRYLFDKLSANPSLTGQSAAYPAFLGNQASSTVGLLQSSAAQTKGLFASPTSIQQALDANYMAIMAELASIADIDASLTAASLTEAQQAVQLGNKEAAMSNLTTLQASTSEILAQSLTTRAAAANTIISYNGGIVANGLHEQNEKSLLDLFLKTTAKGLPATLAQRAQVLAIAQQCPETGGYATYWARAWYSALTGILVEPLGCASVGERNNPTEQINNDQADVLTLFELAPNPAQDFVKVTLYAQPDWKDASICLMDLSGRTILSQALGIGEAGAKLSIQAVPDGLYLVSLKIGARMAETQKLVILR